MKQNTQYRKSKLKIVLAAVAVIAAGVVAATFIGYRMIASRPEAVLKKLSENADLSLGSIQHTATRGGTKEWTLKAESAQLMDSEKHMQLKTLSMVYYLKDGKEVYLTADEGVLNTKSNDVEVMGNVVLINDPYELKTEHLKYLHEEQKIVSDAHVEIISTTSFLGADGLTFDMKTRNAVFSGNVEGIFNENLML